jgi:curved DNA-binding protein CbpA
MMIQTFFIALLNFLVAFLESAFQQDPRRRHCEGNDEPTNDNDFFSANGDSGADSRKLQEAYKFMELELGDELDQPAITIEQVKKQYKRLSLRYHPDRNGGSQESHNLMQKLNACFDMIELALEVEGGEYDDNDNDDDEVGHAEPEPTESESETADVPVPNATKPASKKKSQKKKRSKRAAQSKGARKQGNRRQREMREQMEKEMREELERWGKMKTKLEEEQVKISKETSGNLDIEQRQAANRMFMNQVSRRTTSDSNATNVNNTTNNTSSEKPKNYVMEACTNDLVVATRLGMVELAVELLNEQVDREIHLKLVQLQRHQTRMGFRAHIDPTTLGLATIRLRVMTKMRLDEDGNTLLHYAVYFESPLIIRALCHMAQHDNQLEEIVLAQNLHGQIPMDFASIANDPSILPLMQSQHDLVHLYRERTRIFPALQKAAMKLARLVLHVDHNTTLSTILGFLVGRIGFQLHTVVSLAGVFILQGVQTIELFGEAINDDRTDIASMLSFYTLWIGFRILCVVLKNTAFMWLKLFLSAPLFFYCSSRRTKTMIGTALLEGPLYLFGYTTVLFYIPLHTIHKRRLLLPKQVERAGFARCFVLVSILLLSLAIQLALSFLLRERKIPVPMNSSEIGSVLN